MSYQNISPAKAKEMIENEGAILIDVRELDEFCDAHIPYAMLLPMSEFDTMWPRVTFPENKKIIFQCAVGGRSAQACMMASNTSQKTYQYFNLDGGIKEWDAQSLPLL